MESYKMKKLNSNDFHEIKNYNYNKNDINVNLWDLEGSNFFIDKNYNENESKRSLINRSMDSKNKSISLKNISKDINIKKAKNKSINSSYVKYDYVINKKNIRNEKSKSDYNYKKIKLKHNSFFSHKYTKNNFENNLKDEYKKKAKKRFNYSVDYSRNDLSSMALLFSNNNDIYKQNQRINSLLLMDIENNKTDNKSKKANSNISSLKNRNNMIAINSNKQEKSNFHENKINKNNLNIRNIKNINQNIYNNLLKKKKELKLTPDKIQSTQNRKKSEISKRTKENAEKYTNYLYKKKIFTHDYELQNKLKKENEEKEAEKELSQCTFKPQLYKNKYNNRLQSQKNNYKNKSIYEKNSQWSKNLKKKKENEREKKIIKEQQGCTFTPQLSTLPKYNNKKNVVSHREILGEEKYFNKMKKARKIIEEKKKGNNLVEKYDERKKKKDTLPRSVVTFGNFNLEKSNDSEESANDNNNIINSNYYNNININNSKIDRYIFKNIISDININNNIFNNENSERNINNHNYLNLNNPNFKITNTISNKQINNLNININTSKFLNDKINLKKISESSKNKINPSFIYKLNNDSSGKKPNNNIKEKMINLNSNNIYQRENNYDFDNNNIEDKFVNKNKTNFINNLNNLNPTISLEEQEKENLNNSTGTVTKANSIVSLQKKSAHSLPDRPGHIENILCYNINDYKLEKNQDIFSKNINNNNNFQDEDFIKQKKLLTNELHNWSNYDEDSNAEY